MGASPTGTGAMEVDVTLFAFVAGTGGTETDLALVSFIESLMARAGTRSPVAVATNK